MEVTQLQLFREISSCISDPIGCAPELNSFLCEFDETKHNQNVQRKELKRKECGAFVCLFSHCLAVKYYIGCRTWRP